MKNVKYIGVNNPAVSIGGKGETDLKESGISFEKCELLEEIKEKIAAPAKSVDSERKIKVFVPKQTPTLKSNNTMLAADYDGETLYIYFRNVNFRGKSLEKSQKCIGSICIGADNPYNIYTSHKKSGEVRSYFETPISKTEVYASGPSAFEIYKTQMREALENLPKKFVKSDGIVDITDSETIAAIDEAVKLFVAYNSLNPIANIIGYDPDEEPYD